MKYSFGLADYKVGGTLSGICVRKNLNNKDLRIFYSNKNSNISNKHHNNLIMLQCSLYCDIL